jgi:hypothetical protein
MRFYKSFLSDIVSRFFVMRIILMRGHDRGTMSALTKAAAAEKEKPHLAGEIKFVQVPRYSWSCKI